MATVWDADTGRYPWFLGTFLNLDQKIKKILAIDQLNIKPVNCALDFIGIGHIGSKSVHSLMMFLFNFNGRIIVLQYCVGFCLTTWISHKASLVSQMVRNLLAVQETWVLFPGRQDPLEKGMATHSSILAWRIPWTEESGRLKSMGLQRVGPDGETNTFIFIHVSPPPWDSLPTPSPSSRSSQRTEAPCVNTATSHGLSVLHIVMYMFQYYSLNSSHSLLPPAMSKIFSFCLRLYSCPSNRFISTIF